MKDQTYSAFAGHRRVAAGDLQTMLGGAKAYLDKHEHNSVLIFEDRTGAQIDFDFRGTMDDVLERLSTHPTFRVTEADKESAAKAGPGRPKLGVVSREISLLPRHWEWLEEQPGGASASLRRLVEDARKKGQGPRDARKLREAIGRFMTAMGGDLEGYEEATRALYAKDLSAFEVRVARWPKDIREHAVRLAKEADVLEASAS
jgi:hypothetical protein